MEIKEQRLDHLAIIMDGNRRWAKLNGENIKGGYKAGADKLLEVADWCIDLNIKYLTVYAFSIDNWKRDINEINDLMSLLKDFLNKKEKNFKEKGIKIKVIGIEDKIDRDILKKVREIENKTKDNNKLILNIAFNYTGRREIIDIIKTIAKNIKSNLIDIDDIDEKLFSDNLYYGAGVPDPDLIIRTSGEYRISNFLLWEMANSELFFSDIYWPDFSRELLVEIINNFKKRERRYGGTIKK